MAAVAMEWRCEMVGSGWHSEWRWKRMKVEKYKKLK